MILGRETLLAQSRHKTMSTPPMLIAESPWIYNSLQKTKAEDCSLALPMSTAKTTSLHRCSSNKLSEKEPLTHTNMNYFTSILDFSLLWLLAFAHFSIRYSDGLEPQGQDCHSANNRRKCQNKGTFWPCPFQYQMEPQGRDCQVWAINADANNRESWKWRNTVSDMNIHLSCRFW